jgi:hypothetical protein
MLALIDIYKLNILSINDEINRLTELYISNQIIPAKYNFDASHIACASVNNLDILLSFNYRHINKLKTKLLADKINILEGYKGIIISTPMEILTDEE